MKLQNLEWVLWEVWPGQPVLAFPGPNAILCIQPKGKSTTTTSGIIDGEASPVVDSRMQDNLHRQ